MVEANITLTKQSIYNYRLYTYVIPYLKDYFSTFDIGPKQVENTFVHVKDV